jgi:integrase/recombinase XerD
MSDKPTSDLRRRMIADMTIRTFSDKTQHDYIRHVEAFARFLGRSPDTATGDDIRRFQLAQVEQGAQPPKINTQASALRFFFTITLGRADLAHQLARTHYPRKLPRVLTPDQVARLIEAAPSPGLKYKAALSIAWLVPRSRRSITCTIAAMHWRLGSCRKMLLIRRPDTTQGRGANNGLEQHRHGDRAE